MLIPRFLALFLFILLISISPYSQADDLKSNDWVRINVSGVNEALTNNIYAHLGPLPDSSVNAELFCSVLMIMYRSAAIFGIFSR